MNNFIQDGDVITVDPGATVAAGTGIMVGTALFGVAVVDGVSGTPSAIRTRGVVEIAKTSALAISVGDVLYWAPGSSVVNKTSASQRAVGVAVEAAANPSATVKMLLGVPTGPALS
jgi:predicted RecA/RadA family phage recombinase